MKLVITTAFKFTTVHCSRDIAPSDISCKLQEKEGGNPISRPCTTFFISVPIKLKTNGKTRTANNTIDIQER